MIVTTEELCAQQVHGTNAALVADQANWMNATVHIDEFGRIHLHSQSPDAGPNLAGLVVTMQHVGSGILVTLSGRLDSATAPTLMEVLSWPEGTRAPKLYLHMERVWSIDIGASDLIEQLCEEQDAHIIHASEARLRLTELVGTIDA